MEHEVERRRAEVDERREQSPVLRFVVDGAEGVEELVGGDEFALEREGGQDGRGGPVAGAGGHFVEPLFEREVVLVLVGVLVAEDGVEVGGVGEEGGHDCDGFV